MLRRVSSSRFMTTRAVQGFLDQLAGLHGDSPAEPIVRALLARSVERLHQLCSRLLYGSYPRLTRPPLNLTSEEMLSALVERLIKALRETRPSTVRQFFALASQHMRWELNDLARRLDKQAQAIELHESRFPAHEALSQAGPTPNAQRILDAIDSLPEDLNEVFNLVRIQGLTQVEAAEMLGVSPKTIQRRVNRGLVLLAEKLKDLKPIPKPE